MSNVNFHLKRKLPAWMSREVFEAGEKSVLTFTGHVKFCQTEEDMCVACEELISIADKTGELILGFDAEWPVFASGPGKIALIQVCVDASLCVLFHVSCMSSLPKIFVDMIKHIKVKLTGCCIHNDIWKLGRDFNIPVAKLIESGRVIDLGKYANKVLHSAQTWSLERLALHVLSAQVDKSQSVRLSRWDSEISASQMVYAATDAYVSLLIYTTLRSRESSIHADTEASISTSGIPH